ncbi:MAG: hypothetical protein K2X27_20085 [Candidatus Obscuribacterales bacterium]|nr:hypothetical protein [Candidatus Obscuribacterales bacterium]
MAHRIRIPFFLVCVCFNSVAAAVAAGEAQSPLPVSKPAETASLRTLDVLGLRYRPMQIYSGPCLISEGEQGRLVFLAEQFSP